MVKQISRRIISVFIFLSAVSFAEGQILITPQIPPTGLIKKEQLWNIVLVSNSDLPHDIQLQVSMQDIRTGEKVLTGASRLLTVGKGVRQLQINDVSPVQYNYSSGAMVADRTGNGLLPVGSYQICYTLIEQTDKNSLPAQEECLPVEIEPLSPPQLNAPFNSDTVETKYPLFQWIPPAPLTMFSNLNYGFVLVEVAKGQNVNDAVQKNTPIYFENNIKNMFLGYPSSGKALEEGKTYGWQVTANNGNSYAAKTESWAFSVKKESIKIILDYEAYPALKQGSSGDLYICQGKIKMSYKNEANDTSLLIKFYKSGNEGQQPAFTKTINISAGQNYVDVEIKESRLFNDGETYLLEAINSRNEKWTLRFKYKPVKQ